MLCIFLLFGRRFVEAGFPLSGVEVLLLLHCYGLHSFCVESLLN